MIVRTSAETYSRRSVLGGYRFASSLASICGFAARRSSIAIPTIRRAMRCTTRDRRLRHLRRVTHRDRRTRARYRVTCGPSALSTPMSRTRLSAYRYADAMLAPVMRGGSSTSRAVDQRQRRDRSHMPFQQSSRSVVRRTTRLRVRAVSRRHRGDGAHLVLGPLFRWRPLHFRALGFFDSGYIAFQHGSGDTQRVYLPVELGHSVRDAVRAGLRVYVRSVVVPLLGSTSATE